MQVDPSSKEKNWQLVALIVTRQAEEFASSALFDLGTTGIITLEESADNIKLGAYFDERSNAEEVARMVEAEFARADIEKLLGRHVFLNLFVKVREHWRDDERTLNELGIQGRVRQ